MTGEADPIPDALAKRFGLLRRHFGDRPFTGRQAGKLGVGPLHLHRLVQRRLLKSPLYSVFRVDDGSRAATLGERADELALVLPRGAVIARRTAAWLYGVDPRPPDEREAPLPLECVVARGGVPVRRPGVLGYQAQMPAWEFDIIAGLPCTTPTRTAVDVLRWTRPHMGLAVADVLSRDVGVEAAALLDCLGRCAGERYVRQARQLAGWIEPLSESFGETWLRLRILDAGFPRPTAQIPIRGAGGRELYRLDLGWPERKLAVEYDGQEFHSGPRALEADRRRRADLANRFGWHVVGVGKGEVLGPALTLERGIGELLGMEPLIQRRRW